MSSGFNPWPTVTPPTSSLPQFTQNQPLPHHPAHYTVPLRDPAPTSSPVATAAGSGRGSRSGSIDAQLWSNRFRHGSEGQLSRMGSSGHDAAVGPTRLQRRAPLGEQAQNAATSTSTLGLASPFIPSTDSVWGPPTTRTKEEITIEDRLASMEAKINELTLENTKLREQQSPMNPYMSPIINIPSVPSFGQLHASPRSYLDQFGLGMSVPGYGSGFGGMSHFGDEDQTTLVRQSSIYDGTASDQGGIVAPNDLRYSILSGTFNLAEIPVDCVRPIVWIIAKYQPRNTAESTGLKTAVNALASRMGCPRSMDGVAILIDSIIEWAKPLCFTSCGNYLCQQLLERGDLDDKIKFIEQIRNDIVKIASDKFGTHVLCKAIGVKDLETPIAEALLAAGIFDSLRTGARRLWREYLERRRQSKELDIFHRINSEMKGRWTDLACANEHGSIAVQQVFEVFANVQLMEPCAKEILSEISRIGNNQFGHFVVSKLMGSPTFFRSTYDAILTSYPPIATTHHGVNFAKLALQDGGRAAVMRYVDALCQHDDGRTPGIVAVATSSIGKGHLSFLMSCLTPAEHTRVRHTCRAYSTTLRNSQSGNDLLRNLGLIHAGGNRRGMAPQ